MDKNEFEKILQDVDISNLPERDTIAAMEAKLSNNAKKYNTWRRACMAVQYFPIPLAQIQVLKRLNISDMETRLLDQIQLEEIRLKDGEAGVNKHKKAEREIIHELEKLKKCGDIEVDFYTNMLQSFFDMLSGDED